MKTSYKWSIAGLAGVAGLALTAFQLEDEVQAYIVSIADTAFGQTHEDSQYYAWEHRYKEFKMMEADMCHGQLPQTEHARFYQLVGLLWPGSTWTFEWCHERNN